MVKVKQFCPGVIFPDKARSLPVEWSVSTVGGTVTNTLAYYYTELIKGV
jgi:hypothetical protein